MSSPDTSKIRQSPPTFSKSPLASHQPRRIRMLMQRLMFAAILAVLMPLEASAFSIGNPVRKVKNGSTRPFGGKVLSMSSKNDQPRAKKIYFRRNSITRRMSSLLDDLGFPSSPGWRQGRLDKLTDWADNETPNRPIVSEYDPNDWWLRSRWKGTVLKLTIR